VHKRAGEVRRQDVVAKQLLPVVSLLACLALGEERFAPREAASWAKVGGVSLAVGGAAFVAYSAGGAGSGLGAGSANLPAGLAFCAVQLALGGSYSAVQKPLLRRYPPLVVAAWGYVSGLGLLTLSVVTGASADAWQFSQMNLLAVAYAGVLSSFVAYYAMAVANSLAGPLFLTAFFPVQPLATAVIAHVALGAELSLSDLGGAAIVSLGLLCVVGAKAFEGLREAASKAGDTGAIKRSGALADSDEENEVGAAA
jgi:drug/metabolite transporter (DMT)-like permease